MQCCAVNARRLQSRRCCSTIWFIESISKRKLPGVDPDTDDMLGARRGGLELAFNDFGLGESSLSDRRRYPINETRSILHRQPGLSG